MKKIAIIFIFLSGCCVQHVIVKNNGLTIENKPNSDSILILRTILGEHGFAYYSNCPGNDSMILKNIRNESELKKMNVKLRKQSYFADGFMPISELKYIIQDTSVLSIDTIISSKDSATLDQGIIKFRIKKDGETTLLGFKSKYMLKANITVQNGKVLPTGFPRIEFEHYTKGNCKCKS